MEWTVVLEFIHDQLKNPSFLRDVDTKRNEVELMSLIMSNSFIKEQVLKWLKIQNNRKTSKCSEQAKYFKSKGNEHFKKKEYSMSIQSYTNCARYASFDDKDFSISLANRSAAFFYMNKYEKCLEDIDVAFASNYPKELRPKLHLRAVRCWIKLHDSSQANKQLTKAQNLITNDENISVDDKKKALLDITELATEIDKLLETNIPETLNKISQYPETLLPPNPLYPSASSALTRNYSPTRGRYVTAQKPIRRGEILYVEKPFAFVTLNHIMSNAICVHCCSNIDTAYPCRGCTHVSFCSKKCWTDSWSSHHQWECIGYQMNIWNQIGIAHLTLKVLFSSVETIDKVQFNDVQKLVTNFDKRSTDDLIMYSITAVMLVQYLEIYTNFFQTIDLKSCLVDKFTDEKYKISGYTCCHEDKIEYVGKLLLRYVLQLINNGHAITRLNTIASKDDIISDVLQQRIATGIYPSISIMNHSCDSNIMNVFWKNYIIVKAIKDIPVGGEIFNCYGLHFRRNRVEERQIALKNQYCFTCNCEPCTNQAMHNFLDRFSALKCLKCDEPLTQVNLNFLKCLECQTVCSADMESRRHDLQCAEDLFMSAESFIRVKRNDEAFEILKRCLNIRQKWLFRDHDDVTKTYDELGKVCALMKHWYDSILYLEKSIRAVQEKFGLDSIELAHELNKLTDICFEYFQETRDRNTSEYRYVLTLTCRSLAEAEKIINIVCDPWCDVYSEIMNKHQELSGMFPRLCIQ